MKRKQKGTALFYTRDSGGRHEMTPGEYVGWAQRTAKEHGLAFDGTPDVIQRMMKQNDSATGDIYLDYGVKGNTLVRKGLDALKDRVERDMRVSHVMIPRRDRLSRPDNPIDAMVLEHELRSQGLTLVFMDRSLSPVERGKRADVVESIIGLLQYDRSGEDRRTLANKMIHTQIALAKRGLSTGGRPPYGFKRSLVKEDGTEVRDLGDGERVRMPGHHVAWLPDEGERLETALRICQMLKTMPASRVAAKLTEEGVPAPDAGRWWKDNNVDHAVSGVWHQTTVTNIGRHPLLSAIARYGQRSMGDQLRYTPEGPRELNDSDFRLDDAAGTKPKVIRNAPEDCIQAAAKFAPLVTPKERQELTEILDSRAGTQRGKPRSRDPDMNPLGCRVFDLNCGWPLYRQPYSKSFRYKCGLYQQSNGQRCAHNHIDGPAATRFLLSCVQQRLLAPTLLKKLERRIQDLAAADAGSSEIDGEHRRAQADLSQVQAEREQVGKNMARSESDQQYQAISKEFNRLCERERSLRDQVARLEARMSAPAETSAAVERAMAIAQQLTELAANADTFRAAREIFELTNARLFLKFQPTKVKRRTLNKLAGGVVTFGKAPPPVKLYEGVTSRKKIRGVSPTTIGEASSGPASPPQSSVCSGEEGKSLGNVSRGDRI